MPLRQPGHEEFAAHREGGGQGALDGFPVVAADGVDEGAGVVAVAAFDAGEVAAEGDEEGGVAGRAVYELVVARVEAARERGELDEEAGVEGEAGAPGVGVQGLHPQALQVPDEVATQAALGEALDVFAVLGAVEGFERSQVGFDAGGGDLRAVGFAARVLPCDLMLDEGGEREGISVIVDVFEHDAGAADAIVGASVELLVDVVQFVEDEELGGAADGEFVGGAGMVPSVWWGEGVEERGAEAEGGGVDVEIELVAGGVATWRVLELEAREAGADLLPME